MRILIPVAPVGASRPRVPRFGKAYYPKKYEAFRKEMEKYKMMFKLPENPKSVSWRVYFAIPKSWTKKKKAEMMGQEHYQKPDRDNIDKGILDGLFKEDSSVARGTIEKYWDDGYGARMEIFIDEEISNKELMYMGAAFGNRPATNTEMIWKDNGNVR